MKIANPNPSHCSACFNQAPEKLHVDFEAAWDGPVLDSESKIKQVIDDLYLCEDCLISAYKMLDPDSEHAVIEKLTLDIERAVERGIFLQDTLQQIRDLLQASEPKVVIHDA